MPFHAWKSNLLRNRGLNAPDGRHLYAYRLESAEFYSLKSLLMNRLAQYQQAACRLGHRNQAPLDMIAEKIPGFPALFVLYAAEWWRQCYDGSGFSWQPILQSLGTEADGWNQAQRSACVRKGLQDWRLSPRESGGLRYLGTIALQGGLPMRLLAEARGGIGRLLRGVLKEAAKSRITVHDIQGWVASLDNHLPRTYRQPEIHVLLAQVVITVLRLKEEAKLTQSAGAIAQLEQYIPSWRERFPLPVGDTDAQGLIEQLIRDAVTIRIERKAVLFPIERFLGQDSDGLWHLSSSLTLPDDIDSARLSQFFREESSAFPRLLNMTLMVAGQSQTLSLRRLAGHDKYRIERRPCGVSDESAVAEHTLRLSTANGRAWTIPAPRGEELDDNLPWVFDAREESPRLLRQGSGSVATYEAIAAVPPSWVAVSEDGSATVLEGRLHLLERQLYRIRGIVHFSGGEGEIYRIRTGRAETSVESYMWSGQRLWQEFVRPGMAFLGRPRLYRMDEEGHSQPVANEPCWRPLGASTATTGNPLGPVEMRYPATGEVKHRARMVILPAAATLRLEFIDAGSGRIYLENWGAMSVQVLTDMTTEISRVADDLIISLRVTTAQRAPEWVELDVYWPHTPNPARLRLPYPAKGARIYDAHGDELRSGSLLAANQLLGVRVHALGGNPAAMARMSLEFRLNGTSSESSHDIFPPRNSVQVEIRLQDYAAEIAHLLANDDSPDATIGVVLRISGEKAVTFRIARYACRMERDVDRGFVQLDASGSESLTPDEITALPVMAFQLEAPEEEVVHLAPVNSEGIAVGAWKFAPETREPGSWLIFPAPAAGLLFRPILWTVSGTVVVNGYVAHSIGITQQTDREHALDTAIEVLANDFLDSGWADIERLVSQLSHLPLVTLDLWRRFAHSVGGMAALAMRFSGLSGNFLERFAQELPFSWETVPFKAWRGAIEQLKKQCDSQYGTTSNMILKFHVEKRIDELSSLHPALAYMLGIARAAAVGEVSNEVNLFRQLGANWFEEKLFSKDQGDLQHLLRNHAEADWPTAFNSRAIQARKNQSQARLLCQESFGFRDGLINLPILLAIQAATNDIGEWFDTPDLIHDLRTDIAFDPDWFTNAYNLTVARCLASGLMKLETEL